MILFPSIRSLLADRRGYHDGLHVATAADMQAMVWHTSMQASWYPRWLTSLGKYQCRAASLQNTQQVGMLHERTV